MSLIKSIKAQLGLSVTAANNFTLDASADDGTMKLVKGASTNVITIASDGQVAFPQNPVEPEQRLGVGQTWQNMTGVGGRASGATITNTSGRPIEVKVKVATTGVGSIGLTVDGLLLDAASMSTAGYPLGVGATIPDGSAYVVTVSAATIQLWAELR